MSKTFNLYFSECEHHEDFERYREDIIKAGGKIENVSLDFDEETADIIVLADNIKEFQEKFSETESFDFLSYKNW